MKAPSAIGWAGGGVVSCQSAVGSELGSGDTIAPVGATWAADVPSVLSGWPPLGGGVSTARACGFCWGDARYPTMSTSTRTRAETATNRWATTSYSDSPRQV